MIKSLNGSFGCKKPIATLRQIAGKNKETFLQTLLSLCRDKTYDRIMCCPRFPSLVYTLDLELKHKLFNECLSDDPNEAPVILASLFEAATTTQSKKLHGQYFTPPDVADVAIQELNLKQKDIVWDAGCGTGIFASSILRFFDKKSLNPAEINYLGIEEEPVLALSAALSLDLAGAPESWRVLCLDYLCLQEIEFSDFINKELFTKYRPTAIISNPPFVRCHRLGERKRFNKTLGLSGFSGLHSFFLALSARLLPKKMVFVLPLEMDYAKYGVKLFKELESSFTIQKKGIFCQDNTSWTVSDSLHLTSEEKTKKLVAKMVSFQKISSLEKIEATKQYYPTKAEQLRLGNIAEVHRGISTGANNYFVLTDAMVKEIGISAEYLKRIIPPKMPRRMLKSSFTIDDWEVFCKEGMRCWLFYVKPNTPPEKLTSEVRQYIRMGEREGVNLVPTCKGRKDWYSIKLRDEIPDLVFTYMFRDNPLFLYNEAKALNLTNFIGVYLDCSIRKSISDMQNFAIMLNHEINKYLSHRVIGRKYLGGFKNIGPSDLSNIPISDSIISPLISNFSIIKKL